MSPRNWAIPNPTNLLCYYLGLVALLLNTVSALNCNATFSNATTTYPNQAEICTLYSHLDGTAHNYTAFFSHVVDNVNWTIEGTHPLAGQYNKSMFINAIQRIDAVGAAETPLLFSLTNVIGGGNEPWCVAEIDVRGICTSGLIFNNRYAWATRFNTEGMIVQVRAYLDSALVSAALIANELGPWTYSDIRNTTTPFVTLNPAELKGASALQQNHD